jgi:transposase
MGRANKRNPEAGGDSLDDLKQKLKDWLKVHAKRENIIVNQMKIDLLCEAAGHFPPLWTPPYHPELQPIELLWRSVKGYVSRKYVGSRNMTTLDEQVREGFRKYGSAEFVSNHFIKQVLEFEHTYKTEGYNGDVVPDSWDDYILTEDADLFADFNEGVMEDIDEEDDGVVDGFAEADIGE